MSDIVASRVARRFLAKGIPMGDTFQNEKVRIHRYRDLLVVTDLRDAGKRGKTVTELSIRPTYKYEGNLQTWLDRQTEAYMDFVTTANPLGAIASLVKDFQKEYPGEIDVSERSLKAIDVEPFGERFEFKIPLDNGGTLSVRSSPIEFGVKHTSKHKGPKGNEFDMDTLYWPVKKKDAVLFYGWMKENSSKLKNIKSINDLTEIWQKLGVQYNSH